MKIYTVTKMSKIDYDFSVTTTTHGAFLNFDNAVKRLKEVVEKFKKSIKNDIEKYSNIDIYPDEENGLYTEDEEIDEKFNDGYWECHFGCQEHYEFHCIAIDEYEIEDADESDEINETKSKYQITILKGTEDEEQLFAYLTPSEVEKIDMDIMGDYNAEFKITTEDGQTIEIGIIDEIRNVIEK